jgi:hypothetical protein
MTSLTSSYYLPAPKFSLAMVKNASSGPTDGWMDMHMHLNAYHISCSTWPGGKLVGKGDIRGKRMDGRLRESFFS